MSASTSLEAERLAVGVLPRSVPREPEAMLAGWGDVVAAACEDAMLDDEVLFLAVAGGVGEARRCESMVGRESAQPAAARGETTGRLVAWESSRAREEVEPVQ